MTSRRGRPAEAGEQRQRAVADVLVRVRARGLASGGTADRRPARGGRVRAAFVRAAKSNEPSLSIAAVTSAAVGCRGGGRGRLRRRRQRAGLTARDAPRPATAADKARRRLAHHSTSFSASCRYAASLRGNATGYWPV